MIRSKRKKDPSLLKEVDEYNINDLVSLKGAIQKDPSIINKPIDSSNNTLLHFACNEENSDLVDFLLREGADPNVSNIYNINPFHLSVSKNKIFNLFLKKRKTDVTSTCVSGNTILHFAAMRFFKITSSQLEILIKRGLDINKQNNDLETSLHLCCKNGNSSLAESLMKCPNLNIGLKNKNSHTPIYLAAKNKRIKILKLFLKYDQIYKADKSDLKNSLAFIDKNSDIYTQISTYIKKPQAFKSVSHHHDDTEYFVKKKDKLSRTRSHSPKIYRHSKRFYSQDWAYDYSTNNVKLHQSFSQATYRILVLDELRYGTEYHDQTSLEREIYESKYRKELEDNVINELDSIIDRSFALEIIQKILNSRSFKWYPDQHKNKIELFKWMVDFLNNTERQVFLRYLKENYSSDVSIQIRNKKKDKRLTLRDKMIEPFTWEINVDDIIFEQAIGIGSFGSVYRGRLKTTNDLVALKQLVNMSDEYILTFIKEISILSRINHPNIIQFKGASFDNYMILVMEYAELGDLKSYLQKNKVDWRTKVQFVKDVSSGMKFLHNRPTPLVHRDLKCQNILVTKKGQLKVSDFGLSKFTDKLMTVGSAIGSLNWLAPEVLRGDNYISLSVDIYAFGMVMYEILTDGESPFAGYSPIEIIKAVEEGKRPPIPENCDPQYKNLMERCWLDDPLKRPSFSEIDDELEKMLKSIIDNGESTSSGKRSPIKKRSTGNKSPRKRMKESSKSPPKSRINNNYESYIM